MMDLRTREMLIEEFKRELVRTLGVDRANEYSVEYYKGWFTFFTRGNKIDKSRRKGFEERIERLKTRPSR